MPSLQPGQFSFKSICHLGQGGLGSVDLIEITATNGSHPVGTLLARKQLTAQWANDPGAQQRFDREIQLLKAMHHPGIVTCQGESLPASPRFYVMPYFQATLRSRLNSGWRATLPEAVLLGHALASALDYAHNATHAHRDIKPDNVLLHADGAPVLSDWGLGQFIHAQSKVLNLTMGGPLGTAYYCPLEQWASGKGGIPGDVYSLGMTLAEIATPGLPIPIASVGQGIHTPVFQPGPGAANRFNALISKMTQLVASKRHQSMAAVTMELAAV
jgi:eukaryotic-like serine/threonine-protein kinase